MNDLVSILIPAYNAERWIKHTIKSSLAQTWPNKEIIIVDDGSTDNTYKIAKEFESKSVKVIAQENKGGCSARNKALSFAQGDFIQWLDADDFLAPDKISQQLKYSDSGRTTRILFTSAWAKFYYHHQRARFIPNSLWQDLAPVDWITKKLSEIVWMNPATWLVSRKLTELSGPWDERLFKDQDGEYICRVVAVSEKVKFVREAKCYYRIGNVGSVSTDRSYKAAESFYTAACSSINCLRSLEDSDRTRVACLRFLENRLGLYYPDKHELVQKTYDLARELGGNLKTPTLSWKYSLIKKVFGYKVAKDFAILLRKAKIMAIRNGDRFLYYLSTLRSGVSRRF